MESETRITRGDMLRQGNSQDHFLRQTTVRGGTCISNAHLRHRRNHEAHAAFPTNAGQSSDEGPKVQCSSMSIADFVQSKFIPEYVATKSAGRAHFLAILKHILTPEQVSRACTESAEKATVKFNDIQGWPYMDSLPLCEISRERIQDLIAIALQSGYSIQTVTHIRNVISAIFTHATTVGCYSAANPARLVTLPAMTRKKAHTLTLTQLNQVMALMGYPEKGIALFAILTEMNIAEICGLQWKYVNLSDFARLVEGDWLPSRTIAVRKQWYRGQFGLVVGKRERLISVSQQLCSILRDLKHRNQFTGLEDFVIASRSGTPVYPENIAARRLKSIGRSVEMPWLTWNVFRRTHIDLRSRFGRQLNMEYERALPLHNLMIRQA